MFAMVKNKTYPTSPHILKIVRENKRHVWVDDTNGGEWQLTKAEARWRYATREEAEKVRREMAVETRKSA